jgi:hypothetical protein
MKTLSRLLLVTLAACVLASYVSASTIMVGEPRPPTNPAYVKVYMETPRKFDRIAIIRKGSSGSWAFSDQGQVDEAIAKIRVEAAKVGANGILLQVIETNSGGGVGIGIGGLGFGGGHHGHHGWHGNNIGIGGSFYAPIINKTVQAEAIYVFKK